MRPVVIGTGQKRTDRRHTGMVVQALRFHTHDLKQHIARDRAFRRHPLAACLHDIDMRGLFIGREIRLQVEPAQVLFRPRLLEDPAAGSEGCATDHVLTGGVAGRIVEPHVGELVRQVLIDRIQLRHTGGSLGRCPDLFHVIIDPVAEITSLTGGGKDKHRCALHVVTTDRALDAPAVV